MKRSPVSFKPDILETSKNLPSIDFPDWLGGLVWTALMTSFPAELIPWHCGSTVRPIPRYSNWIIAFFLIALQMALFHFTFFGDLLISTSLRTQPEINLAYLSWTFEYLYPVARSSSIELAAQGFLDVRLNEIYSRYLFIERHRPMTATETQAPLDPDSSNSAR